jgi:chromosome segregation ATPase
MIPQLIATSFVINPVLGIAVAAVTIPLGLGIAVGLADKKKSDNPPQKSKKPEEKVGLILKKTEKRVNKIASDTLKQQSVLGAITTTVKHNSKRVEHSAKILEKSANTLACETDNTQQLVRQINHLTRELKSTNMALNTHQKALDQQENSLNKITATLKSTQVKLKNNLQTQNEEAKKVLHHVTSTEGKQKEVLLSLLDTKEAKINHLEQEILGLRTGLRTITRNLQEHSLFQPSEPMPNRESQARYSANQQANKGSQHATSHK